MVSDDEGVAIGCEVGVIGTQLRPSQLAPIVIESQKSKASVSVV